MPRYRDMTTPELAAWAEDFWTYHEPAKRLLYAMSQRLLAEYEQRNNTMPVFKHPVRLWETRGKYPFAAMRVGDFFDVPEKLATRAAVANAAHYFTKTHRGFRFETSTLKNEYGERTIRCWRRPAQRERKGV